MPVRPSAKVAAFLLSVGVFDLAAAAEPTYIVALGASAYMAKEFRSTKHFQLSWRTCCEPTDIMFK